MNRIPFFLIVLCLTFAGPGQVVPDPGGQAVTSPDPDAFQSAERLHAEGSYAAALESYRSLDRTTLTEGQLRLLEFRLADASWRSAAASSSSDTTALDQARAALGEQLRQVGRQEDRDEVWASTAESLGDFWWTRRNTRNWHQAFTYYRQALDWWAGSAEIERARKRYLEIVWKCAEPPQPEPYYYYGYYGNQLPLDVLDGALRIAVDPDDRAHAGYLIGMTLRNHGDERSHRRTAEAFEQAISRGRSSRWYDDALFHYASWTAASGRRVRTPEGTRVEPDYVRAIELYERLTGEFRKGETRYFDQATEQIRSITASQLGVVVSNLFMPGSEVQYYLSWRNVAEVQLALHAVNLVDQVHFEEGSDRSTWLSGLDVSGQTPVQSWTHATGDTGRHLPGQEVLSLADPLPGGAYLLVAEANGQAARELILVTGTTVMLQHSPTRALVYFCRALDGSPVADGEVALWVATYRDGSWRWERRISQTDENGLAEFDLASTDSGRQLFIAARDGDEQAFAVTQNWYSASHSQDWRIYVFTDRPAYRPTEEVHWKLIARQIDQPPGQLERYSTPSDRLVRFVINDPHGSEIDSGELRLNRFGSAWGTLKLGAELPLGEYRVTYRDDDGQIGSAMLFRMEEYKLPEFAVTVETPQDDGRPRTFRVGETVEADVVARYYFGGDVANATVEIVVYQKPLHIWWQPSREFPWFFEDFDQGRRHQFYGQGQVVHRETLRTDAEGRATVRFDTPEHSGQDFEYTVEARVTDASRREVVGRGNVRVSRQRYFAFARPAHQLYRPGDRVRIDVSTVDANQQPIGVEGTVRVTRERWVQTWLDPSGNEVGGEKLAGLKRSGRFPPPPARPGDPSWRLRTEGYEQEEVSSRLVRTGDDGKAEIEFVADRDGYYRIAWSGDADETHPVSAETTVWVADRDSHEIGYHHGGVQILVDQDSVRAGSKAAVMISVPVRDSYVLFAVEAEDLLEWRLVHVTGTVKLIELDVSVGYVPNVYLSAAMIRDGQLYIDHRQLVVPPVEQFLQVELETERPDYEPGDRGTLSVTTRDHDGNPVAAEVALALVDEAVFYIQQDYAGDPRRHFYGSKRPRRVQLQSTLQHKPYGLRTRDEKGEIFRTDGSSLRERQEEEGVGGREQRAMAKKSAFAADSSIAAAPTAMAEGMAMADEDAAIAEPNVQVRSDFRSTALWLPDLVTGDDGRGTVEVTFPDSLTTWKATARASTAGSRFGIGDTSARTRMPLIVRLQAPRFFVVGDELLVSAVVNNNTDSSQTVDASIDADGLQMLGAMQDGRLAEGRRPRIEIPAGGEARIDWMVAVEAAGTARIEVIVTGGGHGDAMERSYPIYEHGVEKFVSRSGKVRGDEVRTSIDLPRERRDGSTSMTIQVTPSMAVTMLDALPYLIDYPYGCVEQTMSRFLPAAITARTLADLGLEPDAIADRIFGGIEAEHAGKTHRGDKRNPEKLKEMLDQGLQRLYDFQHADGGWGWWKEGESDHFMTAYVVWGLGIARDAELQVDRGVLRRAAGFLDRELVEEEEHLDLQAFMLHALASLDARERRGWQSEFQRTAFDNLWERRDGLNAYSRALLALAAHYAGDDEHARVLARNLANGVKRDARPDVSVVSRDPATSDEATMGTAHWGEDGLYWRWSEGGVEATAFALRALLAIDPGNELIEPVTHWLIKNRRGAQWSNTRDTAIVVLTMNDYLRVSGELGAELEYDVFVNDRHLASNRVTPDDVLGAPSRLVVDPAWLVDGPNELRITRKRGRGALYFAAEATYFSLEEPIAAAGNEIFARRRYFKLEARPTLLRGFTLEKLPLDDAGSVKSGERVEVVLTVEAKNNYEYLVFEDLKPAGLEAVQIKSGEAIYARELKAGAATIDERLREPDDYTGRRRFMHQELRDRKVAFFLDKLPEGIWEIRYELRAEVPGTFHALPLLGHAMYVPEIRCNGREVRIEVLNEERAPAAEITTVSD